MHVFPFLTLKKKKRKKEEADHNTFAVGSSEEDSTAGRQWGHDRAHRTAMTSEGEQALSGGSRPYSFALWSSMMLMTRHSRRSCSTKARP